MCEHKRNRRDGTYGTCKRIRCAAFAMAALLLIGTVITVQAVGRGDARDKTASAYQKTDTSRYEVLTNRHTQYVEAKEAENLLTTEGFEEKLNNGTLAVWYGKEQEALRIVDQRSGYVWGCIDDRDEYGLNKKWTGRATSMCYITYFNLEGKEESAALSEGAFKAKYHWGKEDFTCEVSAKKLGISFTFQVSIEGEKLIFSMKDESIEETGKSKLAKVSFMSFLGSVYEDTAPGYVLVPDGSGALIRFAKAKPYNSGYSQKVYGNDLGIDKDTTLSNLNGNRTDDYATEEHRLSLPLWGVVHGEGQNGFLATVDSGELHAVINATPAGAENQTVKFTRAYADFAYRCQYNKRVSNSRVVAVPQEEPNEVNPVLTYTFLTGEKADYSGMAEEYRSQLLGKGLLPSENSGAKEPDSMAKATDSAAGTSGDIPLMLGLVGSEVKEGFLRNGLAPLTTAEQAEDILKQLNEAGITNVSMLLSGWNKGGYHGASYGEVSFEKKVGSRTDIEQLRDKVEENGGRFALAVNAITANQDQIRINRDAALNATLDTVLTTIPNKSLMYPDTYYLRHTRIKESLEKAFTELEGFNLLLEGTGKYLHSDYTIRDEITRNQAQKELLETVGKADKKLLLDGANLYLLKYAGVLLDMPVSGSQYVYETDSVPFLPMVLRGSLDYYAPYSNQGFYDSASILKMIEYGAYPSFLVMGEDNFALNDTPLENHFSLSFKDWEEQIHSLYGTVNEALKTVKNAGIRSHRAVAEGVYCTGYDNGVSIYVNYTGNDYVTEKGMTVTAGGYAVEEQP